MKIFDTRWVGNHGIGRFAKELRDRMPDFLPLAVGGRPSGALDPLVLQRHLRANSPTLFFSPGFNPPLGSPCPFVFCVHDLNHLYIKENSSVLKRAYYRYIVRPAISRARVVITGSEFSKSQIIEWSGVASTHIRAVGYGVSDAFVQEGQPHEEGGRPYFLCVGNEKAHKNLIRTMQSFAQGFRGSEFRLVLTGQSYTEQQLEIGRLGIGEQVVFVGSVSDEQLARLYRGATGLVYVSFYEGFGLPIIESMACGTPVLTSNVTATPEVAGNAAILVDPYDVEAIAHEMKRLADDSALRGMLRERGLERARLFSWENTASNVRAALATCG